ncbi:MAG: FHA domain-containing protein [Elainellaceae cyanobacterium]
MITLLLLHPLKQTPVQVWPFDSQTVIRIGRSTDNDVILYSAVVSRHHVELRCTSDSWEVINLGTNGTYVDGKRITKTPVADGAIIRLARSGPNVQIRLGSGVSTALPRSLHTHHPVAEAQGKSAIGQNDDRNSTASPEQDPPTKRQSSLSPGGEADQKWAQARQSRSQQPLDKTSRHLQQLWQRPNRSVLPAPLPPTPRQGDAVAAIASERFPEPIAAANNPATTHPPVVSVNNQGDGSAWQTIQGHQIRHILGQGDIGITYLADISGKSVVLKTLNASWAGNDAAGAALEMEADLLRHIQHPRIPQVLGQFRVEQQPYVVMEHVEGCSLAQHVTTHGAVPIRQAIAWMTDLCRVLTHLHSFKPPVFHRNIEPANLIRRPSGELALIGFGTVKSLALERIKSVGPAGFIAPGQLDFNTCPQVDFYPIAATLAYLVSGQNPLRFCERQHNRYRLNPHAVPQIPPSLQLVLGQLIQGNYGSASEVSAALVAAT